MLWGLGSGIGTNKLDRDLVGNQWVSQRDAMLPLAYLCLDNTLSYVLVKVIRPEKDLLVR